MVISSAYANNRRDISLENLISEAISNNPEIQEARAQHESKLTRVSVVRYLNDPLIGVEFAGDMRMYSITQQMPFPTKIFAMSQIAGVSAEQSEYSLERKIQEVVSNVKRMYAALFLINKKIETTEKSIAFLKQLFHVASQSYAVGTVPQTDVLRAQVELAIAEEELLTLKDERKIAEAKLNILLNRQLDLQFTPPLDLTIEPFSISLDSLYELTNDNHPILRIHNLHLKQATLLLSYAKQKYIPDFMLKYTQFEREQNFTEQRYMVGLTVPLWFWGKQNKNVSEMKANLKMAENAYKTIENKILLAVKENSVHVDKNQRIADLYRTSIIPQAEANLKSSFVAYEANQINFLSLLESEKILIQYELDYYQAQTDLFTAIVSLEEAVGIVVVNE